MAITNVNLHQLAYWEYNISGEVFIEKWKKFSKGDKQRAESMANHLWAKFKGYDHSVLSLWGACDPENKKILVKVINSGYK